MDLSKRALARMFPRAVPALLDALAELAPELCAREHITTPRRWVHFVAQIDAECDGLSLWPLRENMNYSASRMLEVFPGRVTREKALAIAHQPAAIAEHMYGVGTKVGGWLGNREPGDGARFIGRGLIQTTGRDAYTKIGAAMGVDLVSHPELLERADYAVRSAFADWTLMRVNPLADADDVTAVTRRVNGGRNGLPRRKAALARAKAIWGNGMLVTVAPAASTPAEAPDGPTTPSPLPVPLPPPVPTAGDLAKGSRLMRFIRWLKGLAGGTAVASLVGINSGLIGSAKETTHAVYDFISDPVAMGVLAGACGAFWLAGLALEHFKLVEYRDGRYIPSGWLAVAVELESVAVAQIGAVAGADGS